MAGFIIEYDRNPNATFELKIISLKDSISRAFESLEDEMEQKSSEMEKKLGSLKVNFEEAEEAKPVESGQTLPEIIGQIKKNQKEGYFEKLFVKCPRDDGSMVLLDLSATGEEIDQIWNNLGLGGSSE